MVRTYFISGRFGEESFTKVCDARWRAARRRNRRPSIREKCHFCHVWITRRSPTMLEDHWCMRAYHIVVARQIANLQSGLREP